MMRSTMTYLAAGIIWGIAALLFSGSPAWAAEKLDPSREEVYNQLKKDRKILIKLLKEYSIRGEFPFGKEDSQAISREDPHFDPKQPLIHRILGPNGALCALAHLISRSGNEDLVNELAKKENHFCVGKDNHKAVDRWILRSGLTLEECVRIQFPGGPGLKHREVIPSAVVRNQQRIRRHLRKVVAELLENSEKSLQTAVERCMQAKS